MVVALTVQASPLSRALKGAIIASDNLSGASASQRKGDKRILYASPKQRPVRWVGQTTLHAFDAGKLAVGMPIRYLGIDIGQMQTLDLITARNEVQAKAVLLSGICPDLCSRWYALLSGHTANFGSWC